MDSFILSQEGVKRALPVNTSGPHIVGQTVSSPSWWTLVCPGFFGVELSDSCDTRSWRREGMGRRGYPPEFRRKVGI